MLTINTVKKVFSKSHYSGYEDALAEIHAINKVMGVISFSPDGTIIQMNENFAKVVGYTESEVIGQHHRLFADATYAASNEYKQFWSKLASGQFHQGQYKRLGKNGKEICIEASYNPIFDKQGKVVKVVKYATDITANKLKEAEVNGLLNAINHIQGVIEFDLMGNILAVNDNFAAVTGYSKAEIIGQHHSIFVDPTYKTSA